MYDREQPITFTGTIAKVAWRNPHIYYWVDVTAESGEVTSYAVEGGTPAGLQRQGVRRDFLKIGDAITVEGFLARNIANRVNGRNVTFADGRNVFAGSPDGGPGGRE